MKFLVGNIYNFHLSHENQENFEWKPLSSDILKTFITLPFWMTWGPRLNTHAIIATVGPFKVNKTIETVCSGSRRICTRMDNCCLYLSRL
jgi:hypothetical protein